VSNVSLFGISIYTLFNSDCTVGELTILILYELVKEFNQFYHDFSILKEENEALKQFRLVLSASVAKVIKSGMQLLGIEVPERM
jgi:hypothetical protein